MDRAAQRKVEWRIKAIEKRTDNLTPAWRRVGSYLAAGNRKQFTSKGVYYGTPWKPLKPDYQQWKTAQGYGRRMLVLTGAMKVSFTSRPMSIERYYKKSAVFGSDNQLGVYHQHGTHHNGRQAIPARPIMVKNRKVVRDVRDIIGEYVAHGKIGPLKGRL